MNRIVVTVLSLAAAAWATPAGAPCQAKPGVGAQGQGTPLRAAPAQEKRSDRPSRRAARRDAHSFRRMRMPGDEVARNVRRLTQELHWHKTLSGALQAARRKGKPVFFVQALGDLDGFL